MAGITAGYYEYLPPHYGNGALYPLLVFRHGIGENGNGTTELDKVLTQLPRRPHETRSRAAAVLICGDGRPAFEKAGYNPGHDSWTMTYDLSNPQNDIYAWMLSHHQ